MGCGASGQSRDQDYRQSTQQKVVSEPGEKPSDPGGTVNQLKKRNLQKTREMVLGIDGTDDLGSASGSPVEEELVNKRDTDMITSPMDISDTNEGKAKCCLDQFVTLVLNNQSLHDSDGLAKALSSAVECLPHLYKEQLFSRQNRHLSESRSSIKELYLSSGNFGSPTRADNLRPKRRRSAAHRKVANEVKFVVKPKADTESSGNEEESEVTASPSRRQSCGGGSHASSGSVGSKVSSVSRVLSDLAQGRGRIVRSQSTGRLRVKQQVSQPGHELEELLLSAAQVAHHSTTDQYLLAETVAKEVTNLLHAESCTIWWLQGEELVTTVSSVTGCGSSLEGKDDPSAIRLQLPLSELDLNSPEREVCDTKNPCHYREEAEYHVKHTEKHEVREILYHPIKHEDRIIGICKCCNKLRTHDIDFSEDDSNLLSSLLIFVGVSFRNCLLTIELKESAERTRQMYEAANSMLETVTSLQSIDLADIGSISEKIMMNIRKLVRCERSALWVVNKEQNSLDSVGNSPLSVSVPLTVAGYSVQSGGIFHLDDAQSDPRTGQDALLRSLHLEHPVINTLCVPIKNLDGEVIGVTQLVNKIHDSERIKLAFTEEDISAMQLFTSFAGMCLRTSSLIEFMKKSGKAHSQLLKNMSSVLEFSRNARPKPEPIQDDVDLERWMLPVTTEEENAVLTPSFPIHTYSLQGTKFARLPALTLWIFDRYDVSKDFNISRKALMRFILAVRRKYRRIPYHNFTHAFDVMQVFICVVQTECFFVQALVTFLEVLPLDRYLNRLDRFALLVTALCHDIDHMGLNNSFQLKAETPLGVLSSNAGTKSVLEVHHCNLTIEILSNPSTNIFAGLSQEELKDSWRTVIECILGTDMARHQELCDSFNEIMPCYNKNDSTHRRLLMTMLLKGADISNITRPFAVGEVWAEKITCEYHYQGHVENSQANQLDAAVEQPSISPAEITKNQLNFMHSIGMPFYTLLTSHLPELKFLTETIQDNIVLWERHEETT